MEFRSDPRPSPIAGSWYTGDAEALAKEVDAYISSAKIKDNDIGGKTVGVLSPHAGFRYSGRTAGYAYKTVQDDPRGLAVILSPFHHYISGNFITTAHSAYRTPLGSVPVAEAELEELENLMVAEDITLSQVAGDDEHSLEIQLPFLQRAWQNDFLLLPVMVRSRSADEIRSFARCLFEVIKDKDFLLVASSDLSHFYPQDMAEQLDSEMLRRVKALDPARVLTAETEGAASACGAGAIAALLWAAELGGADRVEVLNYSTSADSTGDTSSVVGYGAAAVVSTE